MDENRSERAKRGIESIAHLFLSQLNDQSQGDKPAASRPVRQAPSPQETSEPQIVKPEPEIISASNLYDNLEFTPEDNSDLDNSLAGEIVLAYHLRDPYARVRDYARYQAQHDQRIMLVSIDQYELSLQEIFDNDTIAEPEIIAETEGPASELIPLINERGENYDIIILNIDPSFAGRINEIISRADCVTIISDTTGDGIVRAYQTLKSVINDIEDDQDIQLFICDAENTEQADRAFYKFSETARKFINRVIVPAGTILANHENEARPLDDNGLTESEALALNLADAGLDTEAEQPEPQSISDSNCFVCQSDTYSIASEPIKSDEEPAENKSPAIFNCNYKPSCSGIRANEPEIRENNAFNYLNYVKSLENENKSDKYRELVIVRPESRPQAGPTQLNPLALNCSVSSDSDICSAVSLNFASLTGSDSIIPLEHRPFNELFTNARLLATPSGAIIVLLCCLYQQRDINILIDEIGNWFDDNSGVLATRYRHLSLKTDSPAHLAIISGVNHADLYD
ncbi:MAG: hypothetical protein JXM68_01230, partial [Sedimentisphaerales bacterium]|nr:hypothetical protein [Sedimentisphaerales bacterium]